MQENLCCIHITPLTTLQSFFFFNDTATTEIYTLSLHDALPICDGAQARPRDQDLEQEAPRDRRDQDHRSEEHTSELQSQSNLVCRLLLEKKNKNILRELHALQRELLCCTHRARRGALRDDSLRD